MSTTQLLEASFLDGLRMPHYFNGRLLTAEDLRADQAATLARLAWLGKAAGHGIVEGLMASQSGNTAVQVTAGLGLNRAGQMVRLPGQVTLNLVPPAGTFTPGEDTGLFANCTFEPAGNGAGSLATGAYLLVAMPVSRLEDQAPLKGLSGSTLPPGCAARWEADGVQFKAIRLSGFGTGGSGAGDKNRQNLLAHWCYGSQGLRRLPQDPFTFDDTHGGLAQLAPTELTECDLPLAVFYWQGTKLAFVDAWAARRRPVAPYGLLSWQGLLSDNRVAVAQARFLQFQGQLDKLLAVGGAGSVSAADHFRYLPSVGYLPIRAPDFLIQQLAAELLSANETVSKKALDARVSFKAAGQALATKGSQADLLLAMRKQIGLSGFDLQKFLGPAMPVDVYLIDGESVDFYLQHSWYDEAIDLQGDPQIDVYLPRDVWLRLVGNALLAVLDQTLPTLGVSFTSRASLRDRIKKILPPGVPGGQDVPYAVFVKRISPKVKVPVKAAAPSPGITGEITIWHSYDDVRAEVLQKLVDQAAESNPGATIDLVAQPPGELASKLAVAVAAGAGPDLVLAGNDHLGEWVSAEIIQPVDKLATPSTALLPIALQSVRLSGATFGLPQSLGQVALFYNRDKLPEPPNTLKELPAVIREFKLPVSLANTPYHAFGFFTAFGGQLMDAQGHCTATQGGFVDAMEFFLQLREIGVEFVPAEEAANRFEHFDSALVVDGPWHIGRYQSAHESSLAVAPIPAGPELPARPLLLVDAYFLTTSSQNPANAVKLAALLTGVEAQATLAAEAGLVPARMDAPAGELLDSFRAAAANATIWPQLPQFAAWWEPFQQMMLNVLDAGANPAGEIKKACALMNKANGF